MCCTCLINTNLLTLWMVMNIYSTGSVKILYFLSWLKLIGYRWWMTNIVLKRFMRKKFLMTITRQHQVYGCVTKFINNRYSLLWNIYIVCLFIYPIRIISRIGNIYTYEYYKKITLNYISLCSRNLLKINLIAPE